MILAPVTTSEPLRRQLGDNARGIFGKEAVPPIPSNMVTSMMTMLELTFSPPPDRRVLAAPVLAPALAPVLAAPVGPALAPVLAAPALAPVLARLWRLRLWLQWLGSTEEAEASADGGGGVGVAGGAALSPSPPACLRSSERRRRRSRRNPGRTSSAPHRPPRHRSRAACFGCLPEMRRSRPGVRCLNRCFTSDEIARTVIGFLQLGQLTLFPSAVANHQFLVAVWAGNSHGERVLRQAMNVLRHVLKPPTIPPQRSAGNEFSTWKCLPTSIVTPAMRSPWRPAKSCAMAMVAARMG